VSSNIFTALFAVELGLRWAAEGFMAFFRSSKCGWHVLDVVIVAFSLADWAISLAVSDSKNVISAAPVLRVLRVARREIGSGNPAYELFPRAWADGLGNPWLLGAIAVGHIDPDHDLLRVFHHILVWNDSQPEGR